MSTRFDTRHRARTQQIGPERYVVRHTVAPDGITEELSCGHVQMGYPIRADQRLNRLRRRCTQCADDTACTLLNPRPVV